MTADPPLPTTRRRSRPRPRTTTETWTVPNWDYTTEAKALGPYLYWKLDETGPGTTAADDSSGNGRTGTYNGNGSTNFTHLANGAIVTDTPDTAVTLNNANSCINTPAAVDHGRRAADGHGSSGSRRRRRTPPAASWPASRSRRTGVAGAVHRAPTTGMLYMDGNGQVWFGVYNGGVRRPLESTATLNDGTWHMAVGTVGADGHAALHRRRAATRATRATRPAEADHRRLAARLRQPGRLGGSWTGGNNPDDRLDATVQNRPFLGSLDEFTVYTSELTAANIQFLYWIT